jgi:hypothetical protein
LMVGFSHEGFRARYGHGAAGYRSDMRCQKVSPLTRLILKIRSNRLLKFDACFCRQAAFCLDHLGPDGV